MSEMHCFLDYLLFVNVVNILPGFVSSSVLGNMDMGIKTLSLPFKGLLACKEIVIIQYDKCFERRKHSGGEST
jgi:hypothetical protein